MKIDKKCSVIVVTYNGKKWYDKCFQSLQTSSIPLNIIVIDNNSTDDTVSYITAKFPDITVIQNDENLGFAKANNIGLNIAYTNNADYFFLLNQDAWVEKDTIETLISIAEKEPNFGILSPIHLNGDKTAFDRSFLNSFNNSDTRNAYEKIYLKQEPIVYECTDVNAAAWLISRVCIEKVGGFDTVMFKHYGEDNNYCQRVLYHTMKIGLVPSTSICHDRLNRVDKPFDQRIIYAIKWADVSQSLTKYSLRHFLKVITFKRSFKEFAWAIKHAKSIAKSRKTNKIAGKGLDYILNKNFNGPKI